MGKSAKISRGGNKRRQNIGRQKAKEKAHSKDGKDKSAKKETSAAPKKLDKKIVADKLRANSQVSAVKMAQKPTKSTDAEE